MQHSKILSLTLLGLRPTPPWHNPRKGRDQILPSGNTDATICHLKGVPDKFANLERFFEDLCTDGGRVDVFEQLSIDKILDVFIVSTS